jgi:hypothetical protein
MARATRSGSSSWPSRPRRPPSVSGTTGNRLVPGPILTHPCVMHGSVGGHGRARVLQGLCCVLRGDLRPHLPPRGALVRAQALTSSCVRGFAHAPWTAPLWSVMASDQFIRPHALRRLTTPALVSLLHMSGRGALAGPRPSSTAPSSAAASSTSPAPAWCTPSGASSPWLALPWSAPGRYDIAYPSALSLPWHAVCVCLLALCLRRCLPVIACVDIRMSRGSRRVTAGAVHRAASMPTASPFICTSRARLPSRSGPSCCGYAGKWTTHRLRGSTRFG